MQKIQYKLYKQTYWRVVKTFKCCHQNSVGPLDAHTKGWQITTASHIYAIAIFREYNKGKTAS